MKNQEGVEVEGIGINYSVSVSVSVSVEKKEGAPELQTQPSTTVSRMKVLKDVNLCAKPCEILAIVGPSGAGKSSLLSVLAGRITPDSGSVYVNGNPSETTHFRRISGYVTQNDTLFPLLTVEETLLFSAKLRLRLRLPPSSLRARVAALLHELRLAHVAATLVGSSDDGTRGVSGGERRRLSIGVDVIHDPQVLILDEPTSGLDSSSALQIIDLLKSMAENKTRTIILTIHQPGFRIVNQFGSVLLLAGGSVVQQSTVAEIATTLQDTGLELPPHVNVIEFAMDSIEAIKNLHQQSKPEPRPKTLHHYPQQRIRRTTLHQLFQQSKVVDVEEMEIESTLVEFEFANSTFNEILILSHRFSKIVFRTKELFACKTLQMLVSGLVLGSIFFDLNEDLEGAVERMGLFAFTLTLLLSSTTEALPIFLQEREIVMKETSGGSYRVSSYVIANSIVYLPFLFILAALFTFPVYWLVGLNRSFTAFSHFLLLIWLILYTANSVAVCFAALVPDFIVGSSMISGVMGAFFLFSGYFVSKNDIPGYWIGMHYMSLFKYPYEGFLINEFSGPDRCLERLFGACVVSSRDVLREEGLGEVSKWRNVGITVCFVVLYRFVSYFVLRWRCSGKCLKVVFG